MLMCTCEARCALHLPLVLLGEYEETFPSLDCILSLEITKRHQPWEPSGEQRLRTFCGLVYLRRQLLHMLTKPRGWASSSSTSNLTVRNARKSRSSSNSIGRQRLGRVGMYLYLTSTHMEDTSWPLASPVRARRGVHGPCTMPEGDWC